MEKNYVLGIDFGSDSVRAVVVDVRNGETVGSDFSEYERWMKKSIAIHLKTCFVSIP